MKHKITIETNEATWPDGTPNLEQGLAGLGFDHEKQVAHLREITERALEHYRIKVVSFEPVD